MLRIKCPHCGAGNQDATELDACWQCGKVLGDPVDRTQTIHRTSPAYQSAPTQQLDPSALDAIVREADANKKTSSAVSGQRTQTMLILVALLLIIALIIILIFVLVSRK